jgi:hypothetical protein
LNCVGAHIHGAACRTDVDAIPFDDSAMSHFEVDRADPVRYLLFGARHQETRGGAADVIGEFASEDSARREFLTLRQQRSDRDGWGELARVDSQGKVTRLAWFGIAAAPPVQGVASLEREAPDAGRRSGRWWRGRRQGRR